MITHYTEEDPKRAAMPCVRLELSMPIEAKCIREGHPTVDELAAEQHVMFPREPRELLADFWPADESIDDFLAAMREWRGHTKTDPAA